MKENISVISKIKMCSACGACITVCPTNAISFKESSLGRKYAIVDSNCIHCGLCLKLCPSQERDHDFDAFFSLEKHKIVVGKAIDDSLKVNGQSGGAVTAILSYLFKGKKIDAALICKPVDFGRGVPYVATNASQLIQCQKSIYTPVSLLTQADTLQSFKSVAVVGLPCHLSAMRRLMKMKKIPVAYMLGLICDRTLCSCVSDSICTYLKCENSKSILIKWRDKNAQGFSYHNAPISVTSDDGNIRIISSTSRQKIKKYFTPPRCLVCPDKLNLSSDLVFGDPWNIPFEDNMGESLIIANTLKGCELLNYAVQDNVLSSKECTSEQLDKSQHIKERRKQVIVYSRIFSLFSFQKHVLLFSVPSDKKASVIEFLRALYGIVRFYMLELLPKVWVCKYIAKKINLCNAKD